MKKEIYRYKYVRPKGYVTYHVHYDNGSQSTIYEHREIMEKHLNRIEKLDI